MNKPVAIADICAPSSDKPETLVVQVYRDILEAVRDGRLQNGRRLPSSRSAAAVLNVSRTTMTNAYDLLRAEGVIETRHGSAPRIVTLESEVHVPSGTVSFDLPLRGRRLADDPRARAHTVAYGLMSPGLPDEGLFPANEWARTVRRVSRFRHGRAAHYEDAFGAESLRRVIAERIAVDRWFHISPDQVVITPGTQSSLALIAQALTDPGDKVAMEDPGYLGARVAFQGASLDINPLPVDEHGVLPEHLSEKARLVYVTPANQYPFGVRMHHDRRVDLLHRARQNDTIILEDDYDSEFMWRGRTMAALSAYDEDGRVIYLGSASKALLPALRIGWIIAPRGLVTHIRAIQRNLGMMANLHAQIALSELMQCGRYKAQLKKITKAYHLRGSALSSALASIPGISVKAPDGGVQVAARFDESWQEKETVEGLAQHGFRVAKLSAYCLEAEDRGIIVGYADATSERIERFCAALRDTR